MVSRLFIHLKTLSALLVGIIFAHSNSRQQRSLCYYALVILGIIYFASYLGEFAHQNTGRSHFVSFIHACWCYLLSGTIKQNYLVFHRPRHLYQLIRIPGAVTLMIYDVIIAHQHNSLAIYLLYHLAIPLTATVLFVYLLRLKINYGQKLISFLASMSFGIYLWQELVINWRSNVLHFCLFLTWLLSLIPKLKLIVDFS